MDRDAVRRLLEEKLDVSLTEEKGGFGPIWKAWMFNVMLMLGDQNYLEDDGEIRFTAYDVSVSVTAYAGTAVMQRSELVRALALVLAHYLATPGVSVMVVEEVQKVLARLGPSIPDGQ